MIRIQTAWRLIGLLVLFAPSFARADETATFYRAVNLNGPSLVIDGHPWEAESEAKGVKAQGFTLDYPGIPLNPGTDKAKCLADPCRYKSSVTLYNQCVADNKKRRDEIARYTNTQIIK